MPIYKNDTPENLEHAKKLRKEMTPHERKLWYLFLRSYPVKVYKQRIIDSYIVDFYCASAKLVIELDGSQHYDEQSILYDKRRTECLEGYGLRVLRFTNSEIDRSFREVCDMIHAVIEERKDV
ncbi:MAG: endonuclease domain-containing protein [Clostridia bacterium]|nr:endonuclease domain-containing protein [Clostridia bacterium]